MTSSCEVSPSLCDVSPSKPVTSALAACDISALRQEPGQSISAFLPQIYSIWDQLAPSEPKWLCAGDSTLFATYRDQQRLILFLVGLSDIYEPVRAFLLHRIPLPTLEQAISELLSEETRLGLVSTSHVNTALATSGSRGRSSGGSCGFSASGSQSSGPIVRITLHIETLVLSLLLLLLGYPLLLSASPTLIDVSDLPALVQQILSASGNPSTALSASTSSFSVIHTADGSSMTVDHVGHVSTSALSLSNTYYVHTLALNLVSIGQLCDLGLTVLFSSTSCVVQDPRTGQTLGIGRRHGRLFQLIHLHLPISTAATTFTSSLSPFFGIWHSRLAALTAAYTINRVPSPLLGNLTPYEGLYGSPPDYHSLRVFGCACFVLLQPHERTKLEPRSRLCCFLGFGIEHRGYRCWDPLSRRLRVSRHVVFWEHKMFSSLSSFQLSSPSTPPRDRARAEFFRAVPMPCRAGKARLTPLTPPYLTDPSIKLFPEDVDVPADPPADTLHVAPSTIVYPVESSSTDPAPLVPPLVHLPSDLPVCRSTRFAHGIVLLLLYVDDMIITRDDVYGISELQDFLHRHFEMKDLDPLSYFLGLEVSSGSTGYSLTQTKYASDLLTRAGLLDCKTASTPLEANARLTSLDGHLLSDVTLYRQLIDNLIYLTVTRSNIAHAVHLVSQFMSAPRSTHYATVLRILWYVKGTLFHGLHFSSQSSLQLYAYSDADWVGDPTDRRSTTGFCFFLGDSLISWHSKKQNLVARSSTEAEYRALAYTTQELL
ncbi:hypothetical protein Acr_00g0051930 [Actinidia rufa]|uniref:Reverse transcriptase Ty1/copia-type domain-containing protein n=1 Tax=Actinidia rufa TaxID=165716 RepID=A0A7J0DMV0_9ERIC|nr:hypothetical protein Acr_00g0051930 [Actinidia rufa]